MSWVAMSSAVMSWVAMSVVAMSVVAMFGAVMSSAVMSSAVMSWVTMFHGDDVVGGEVEGGEVVLDAPVDSLVVFDIPAAFFVAVGPLQAVVRTASTVSVAATANSRTFMSSRFREVIGGSE